MTTLGAAEMPLDPTSSSYPIPQPSDESDTNGSLLKLNVLVIVVPVLLATGLIIWSSLILLGMVQRRRHLQSATRRSIPGEKDTERLILKIPDLFDVHLPSTSPALATNHIQPISVEFLRSASFKNDRKRRRTSHFPWVKKEKSSVRDNEAAIADEVMSRPAQVTVLVAMPNPQRDLRSGWKVCDIGTRKVLYKSTCEAESQVDEELVSDEKAEFQLNHREYYHDDALPYYIF